MKVKELLTLLALGARAEAECARDVFEDMKTSIYFSEIENAALNSNTFEELLEKLGISPA